MKKIVRSSNLALRFYKRDGWTREVIEKYLLIGKIYDTSEKFGDDSEMAYYVLSVGSSLDIKKLYNEQVSKVDRRFDDLPYETDIEYMEKFNW